MEDRNFYAKREVLKYLTYPTLRRDILSYLATGVALYIALSSPTGTRRFLKNAKKDWKKRNAQRVLDRLAKKKLITYTEKSDGTIIATITQAGKQKAREWSLETLAIERPAKWDKRWRVVAFDIAEKRKRAREALRKILRQLNFYQLQRSVFIHPYSCRPEIELLTDVLRIPKHEVLYFSTDRIPREQTLCNLFRLR